jgi:hypothetical protein
MKIINWSNIRISMNNNSIIFKCLFGPNWSWSIFSHHFTQQCSIKRKIYMIHYLPCYFVIKWIYPLYPTFLRVYAADKAEAPAPIITIFWLALILFFPITFGAGVLLQSLGILTLINPSTLYISNVFKPSKTGPWFDSPVWIENPALCKGHIN